MKVVVLMVVALFVGSPAFAKDKQVDALVEKVNKISANYFEIGYNIGTACGMESLWKLQQHAEILTKEELLKELERCKEEAKKKYDIN